MACSVCKREFPGQGGALYGGPCPRGRACGVSDDSLWWAAAQLVATIRKSAYVPNPFILFAAPLEDGRLERVVVPWEFIVETQAAEGDAAVRAQEDRMGLHLYRTLTGRDAISPGP